MSHTQMLHGCQMIECLKHIFTKLNYWEFVENGINAFDFRLCNSWQFVNLNTQYPVNSQWKHKTYEAWRQFKAYSNISILNIKTHGDIAIKIEKQTVKT